MKTPPYADNYVTLISLNNLNTFQDVFILHGKEAEYEK